MGKDDVRNPSKLEWSEANQTQKIILWKPLEHTQTKVERNANTFAWIGGEGISEIPSFCNHKRTNRVFDNKTKVPKVCRLLPSPFNIHLKEIRWGQPTWEMRGKWLRNAFVLCCPSMHKFLPPSDTLGHNHNGIVPSVWPKLLILSIPNCPENHESQFAVPGWELISHVNNPIYKKRGVEVS